jgi:hypothetical protein
MNIPASRNRMDIETGIFTQNSEFWCPLDLDHVEKFYSKVAITF